VLDIDTDMVEDALLLDGLLTVAGAGAGALASRRYDAPVWGMLGAGGAGLLLGGALHEEIDLDDSDRPLVTLAAIDGLWIGGWLPHLLRAGQVTEREQWGGYAAGALGGAALAVMASPVVMLSPHEAGMAGLGSAVGASVGGGVALLGRHGEQNGSALVLGGTAVGLAAGALVAPHVDLAGRAGVIPLGALLGAGEGLVLAWAGRAEGPRDYAGVGLIGAGVGASLGLAAVASPSVSAVHGLTLGGFAAWGAWVGSFAGALANRDSHEITLGGVVGANAGAVAGAVLLKSGHIEPRDFGWLSLAAAAGTVAGGSIGAAFSRQGNPQPILAGLAIGPAVGMAGGAWLLPRLRRWMDHASERTSLHQQPSSEDGDEDGKESDSGQRVEVSTDAPPLTSTDVLATKRPGPLHNAARIARHVFNVKSWTPLVGAVPPAPGTPGPPPFIIGVAGILR
jgi:hypothetical protein